MTIMFKLLFAFPIIGMSFTCSLTIIHLNCKLENTQHSKEIFHLKSPSFLNSLCFTIFIMFVHVYATHEVATQC